MGEFAAKGTVLKWGGTSGTTVGQVVSIEGMSPENASVDTSDLSDAALTFIPPGCYDPGELTIEINHDPSTSGSHNVLYDALLSGTTKVIVIDLPDTEAIRFTANGYVQSFAPSGAVGDKLSASVTFKLTGAIGIA